MEELPSRPLASYLTVFESNFPVATGACLSYRFFMASGLAAKRVLYEGRVQGVGFRFSARGVAEGFDVVGWVKNLPDGRVQLEVQGQSSEVDAFLEAIEKSHLRAHIHRKLVVNIDPVQGLKGFHIRH